MDRRWEEYQTLKLNEMPKDVVKKAVDFLKDEIPEDAKEKIRNEIVTKGYKWIVDYHHFWGRSVRNALRTKANLSDVLLPDGNWDDYYAQCIEIAVGRREYNFD